MAARLICRVDVDKVEEALLRECAAQLGSAVAGELNDEEDSVWLSLGKSSTAVVVPA